MARIIDGKKIAAETRMDIANRVAMFREKYGFAPVLSFNYNGLSSGETAQILNQNGVAVRGGLHCAPTAHKAVGTLEEGTVRVSVSVYNNAKEIEKLIYILSNEKILKKL